MQSHLKSTSLSRLLGKYPMTFIVLSPMFLNECHTPERFASDGVKPASYNVRSPFGWLLITGNPEINPSKGRVGDRNFVRSFPTSPVDQRRPTTLGRRWHAPWVVPTYTRRPAGIPACSTPRC